MVLLAAFSAVLGCYGRREDIVIGSPIAGRNRKEIEKCHRVLRQYSSTSDNFSGDPTLTELLRRVRQICLEAYAYQDMPYEKLIETINPPRGPKYASLLQAAFTFQNKLMLTAPTISTNLELRISPAESSVEVSKTDLELYLFQTPRGIIKGSMQYKVDLFEKATVEKMATDIESVLYAMTADIYGTQECSGSQSF